MLSFKKRVFLLCVSRTSLLNNLVLNDGSSTLKWLTYTTQIRSKNSTISHLFHPTSVTPHQQKSDVGSELSGKLSKNDILKTINAFYRRAELKKLAEENNLDGHLLRRGYTSFRKYCLLSDNLPPELHITFSDIINNAGNPLDIFPYFLSHVRSMFPHLNCLDELKQIGDLSTPANWYQDARKMKRKIIYHTGPTNSGKTYKALANFFNSNSGVYCGPLKLLAVEVFQKAKEKEKLCDLFTGEEITYADPEGNPSNHVSCTVEMCPLENTYDVGVIDEIQMIKDPLRGYAWTRALLGLKAKEIHLCGEESAIELVDSILCTTDETVEVKKYERFTKLTVVNAINDFKNILPGDCIICFSKNDIFKVTKILQSMNIETAVVYGSLPPGTKLAQCKKFNDVNDSCNVLVATDAIGMGLNLSIRRIIFYSIKKQTTNEEGMMTTVPISISQALQIAGRAGRYGSQYKEGFVTTFNDKDLPLLKKLLRTEVPAVMSAGILPTIEQIEMYSFYLPKTALSNLIKIFISLCTLDDSLYFMCDVTEFLFVAELIENLPLPLTAKYIFCCAPIDKKDKFVCSVLVKFAKRYSQNDLVTFDWLCQVIDWPPRIPKKLSELDYLQSMYNVLDLYLWLSYRFEEYFPHGQAVRQIQQELDDIILKGVIRIIQSSSDLKIDDSKQQDSIERDRLKNMVLAMNFTSNETCEEEQNEICGINQEEYQKSEK